MDKMPQEHEFASRGEMVEIRQDMASFAEEMHLFRRKLSELQVSVTERDAELI